MKNVVFIPNIDLGNGRSTPYQYSVKSWQTWCDKHDVELVEYLKNTGDGLALKRSILNALNKKKFKYKYPINLAVNKSECKRRLCSKLFYEKAMEEFKTKAHH